MSPQISLECFLCFSHTYVKRSIASVVQQSGRPWAFQKRATRSHLEPQKMAQSGIFSCRQMLEVNASDLKMYFISQASHLRLHVLQLCRCQVRPKGLGRSETSKLRFTCFSNSKALFPKRYYSESLEKPFKNSHLYTPSSQGMFRTLLHF